MHDAIPCSRLLSKVSIPPIGGMTLVGPDDDESVLVTVRGRPVSAELRERVAEVLARVPHELREVSPIHGIDYARHGDPDGPGHIR
jgi:hypothetical protein